MARAEFRVVCRDDYTKVLFYGGDQTIFRLQKQLLHGGARAARPKPLTFKLIGSFKRRQKTSRQKKPDQKLLLQRQGPLSPKVHANERPLLHRGAQVTHEAPLHQRSMINNPRSPSPSSFASIRGSIISLKASAPRGCNALPDEDPSLPFLFAREIEFSSQHRHRIKHFRVRAGHSHGGERLIEVHTKKR